MLIYLVTAVDAPWNVAFASESMTEVAAALAAQPELESRAVFASEGGAARDLDEEELAELVARTERAAWPRLFDAFGS